MAGYNQCVFVGNLTRDPKMRQAGDKDVCGFRIAVNSGKRDDEALFINVSVWGKAADACDKYLRKGQAVLVSGRISLRTWKGDDGERTELELNAIDVKFLERKKDDDRDDREPGPDKSRSRRDYEERTRGDRGRMPDDDDIPF